MRLNESFCQCFTIVHGPLFVCPLRLTDQWQWRKTGYRRETEKSQRNRRKTSRRWRATTASSPSVQTKSTSYHHLWNNLYHPRISITPEELWETMLCLIRYHPCTIQVIPVLWVTLLRRSVIPSITPAPLSITFRYRARGSTLVPLVLTWWAL